MIEQHNKKHTKDTRYMWFTPVWGYVHQLFRLLYYSSISYIHLLLCTKPQSQASHQTRDLRTEHQILLPTTRSRNKSNFSIKHRALHTQSVAQSDPKLLALILASYLPLCYFYHTFLSIYTFTFAYKNA